HRLHTEGRLTPAQDAYWSARPPEELYDLEADPHETINLASSAAHRPVLERLRAELRQHTFAVGDYSFLPEADMIALAAGGSPTRISPDRYDVRRAFEAAERAARRDAKSIPELRSMTAAPDAAVRYWGAVGLLVRGADAVRAARDDLMRLLDDPSPSVRVAAAEALATHGRDGDADRAVNTLLQAADLRQSEYLVAVAALNAIDRLGPRMGDRRAEMTAFPRRAEGVSP